MKYAIPVLLLLASPAAAQTCWPNAGTWPYCGSSSATDALERQRERMERDREYDRLRQEREEAERQWRRERALRAPHNPLPHRTR